MTQQDYEELKAEVKKTMMAELFKTKKKLVNYEKDIYDYAFNRAYALGKQTETITQEEIKKLAEEFAEREYEIGHAVVKHEMVDNIIKDGFRNHNRLHVASILMAGLLAGGKEKHPVRRALELADALTHEVKEGGKE